MFAYLLFEHPANAILFTISGIADICKWPIIISGYPRAFMKRISDVCSEQVWGGALLVSKETL